MATAAANAKSARTANRPAQHVSEEELRQPDHEPAHEPPRVRTRRRSSTVNEDEFFIPVEEIPEGLSYEWKRFSVNGQEDPFYLAKMREQGWEPVPPSRHPTWVPPGYKEQNVIKGGQILMDRPVELTEEARRENRELANRQICEAEQRLGMTPKGEMTREHPEIKSGVKSEWMRPVPIEE